jgi:hypothetical protein
MSWGIFRFSKQHTPTRNAKPGVKAVRMFDGGGLYLEISPSGGNRRFATKPPGCGNSQYIVNGIAHGYSKAVFVILV